MIETIRPASRIDRVGAGIRHGEGDPLRAQIAPFSWAILDQALFAASNFVLYVVLARWLSVRDYGSFSFAFAVFLILVALYGAVVADPMVVFGSKQYASVFGEYLRRLVSLTLWGTAVIALVLAAASLLTEYVVSDNLTLSAMIGFWALAPVYLVQNLLRRASYVVRSPRTAALGSVAYSGVLVAFIFIVWQTASLSIWSAQAGIGLACLAAAAVTFRRAAKFTNQSGCVRTAKIVKEHARFGQLNLIRLLLSLLDGNVVYILAPVVGSLELVAMWRVLMNLIMPILNVITAFSAVFAPMLARNFNRGRFSAFVCIAFVCLVPGAVIYEVILLLYSPFLLKVIFAGKYDGLAAEAPFVGLFPILYAITMVLWLICNATERLGPLLKAQFVSTTLSLASAYFALRLFELPGAIAVLVAGEALRAGTLTVLLKRERPAAFDLPRGARTLLRFQRRRRTWRFTVQGRKRT